MTAKSQRPRRRPALRRRRHTATTTAVAAAPAVTDPAALTPVTVPVTTPPPSISHTLLARLATSPLRPTARAAGLSPSALCNALHGRRGLSLAAAEALAIHFGLSLQPHTQQAVTARQTRTSADKRTKVATQATSQE